MSNIQYPGSAWALLTTFVTADGRIHRYAPIFVPGEYLVLSHLKYLEIMVLSAAKNRMSIFFKTQNSPPLHNVFI